MGVGGLQKLRDFLGQITRALVFQAWGPQHTEDDIGSLYFCNGSRHVSLLSLKPKQVPCKQPYYLKAYG